MKAGKSALKGLVPLIVGTTMISSLSGPVFAEEVQITDIFSDTSAATLEVQYDNDTIFLGSQGEKVIYVQQLLNNLGYSCAIDGDFGLYTMHTVMEFQRDYGLVQDGVVAQYTLAALESANLGNPASVPAPTPEPAPTYSSSVFTRTLNVGNMGNDVKILQQTLSALGFYDGGIDGDYGQYTAKAVSAFQRAHGLIADGFAGEQTLAVLAQFLQTEAPASEPVPDSEPAAAPEPTSASVQSPFTRSLTIGNMGNDVKILQRVLTNLGYYDGGIDGDFGQYTAKAVSAYERAAGLMADGVADEQMLATLVQYLQQADLVTDSEQTPEIQPAPAATGLDPNMDLYKGERSQAVVALQQRLIDLGYLSGSADGYYGNATEAAVKLFQNDKGLVQDGQAGPYTIKALIAAVERYDPSTSHDQAVQMARAKLNQIGWDLRNAFNWTASLQHTSYNAGTTISEGARSAFTNNVGDCIGKASAFCVMARELGFTCYAKWGGVLQNDGSYADHCWCEILVNGKWYVCDPNFQWGTGRNGYLINYGDSGTWRYKITGNFPE